MIPGLSTPGSRTATPEMAAGWGNWEGSDSWETGDCTSWRDWFPYSPALLTSRGWASGSPRSPQPLLGLDSETICLAQTLLSKGPVTRHNWSPCDCMQQPQRLLCTGDPLPTSCWKEGGGFPGDGGSRLHSSWVLAPFPRHPGSHMPWFDHGELLLHQAGRASVAVTHPAPLSSRQEEKEEAKLPPVAACSGSHRAAQGWEGTGKAKPSTRSPPRPPGSRNPYLKPLLCRDARRDAGAVSSPRTDLALG